MLVERDVKLFWRFESRPCGKLCGIYRRKTHWESLENWRSKNSEKAFSKVFNFPLTFHSISHAHIFHLGHQLESSLWLTDEQSSRQTFVMHFFFCLSFFGSARIIFLLGRNEGHTTTGCVCGTREVEREHLFGTKNIKKEKIILRKWKLSFSREINVCEKILTERRNFLTWNLKW